MQVQSLSSTQGGVALPVGTDASGSRGASAANPSSQVAAAVQVPAEAVQAARHAVDPQELKHALDTLNKTVLSLNRSLQFSVDSDTKLGVVKVVDSDSKEVLRQIPSEEALLIAKAIDRFQGLLIQDKA